MNNNLQGMYFPKKAYDGAPLPAWQETKDLLPRPIYSEQPLWVECYWKAWEIAFRNFHQPHPGSGYVSNFIDAAFNDKIFLWDTAFMTMFCNIAHPVVPGICSLDNFYCKQHADGEISREMVRETGEDFWANPEGLPLFTRYGTNYLGWVRIVGWRYEGEKQFIDLGRQAPIPKLTLDGLNHPILAWAELESYRYTGDISRLASVWEPLVRYFEALESILINKWGLFVTDWAGMDNSPRNAYIGSGVDISCEMVLFARHLIEIANILVKSADPAAASLDKDALTRAIWRFDAAATTYAAIINNRMWDPESRFYYDVTDQGERSPIKTIAGYWSLLSGVASTEQAAGLVDWLQNPTAFKRQHMVPVVAADQPGYDSEGCYWRGAVWSPTTTMVIRGLERYGYNKLAREIAFNHLENVARVYQETGTIWENYAPDALAPGKPAKPNFVGWTGIAPILYFFEYAIGLRPDATQNRVEWDLRSCGETGCHGYYFGSNKLDFHAAARESAEAPAHITLRSEAPVTVVVRVGSRESTLQVDGELQAVV